jgi:iron complex transport system substrate-binding protein
MFRLGNEHKASPEACSVRWSPIFHSRHSGFSVKGFAAAFFVAWLSAFAVASSTRWVTDETGRRVEVPLIPRRIVSLAPSVTETLYALGLGDRVVGRTDYCDFPPEVRLKPSVGNPIHPNLETIVSLRPDLVIATPELNKIEVADQLARFHVPLYGVHARSLDDVLRSLEDLGALAGVSTQASVLVHSLEVRRDAVVRRVAGQPRPRVLYLIWYSPISVPGKDAFITSLITLAGGESVSGDLTQEWAQMSLEEIVRRDPEIILVPRSNESSPPVEKLKQWPGWSATTAVRMNRVFMVGDEANHPSPRLFDALEEFARILHAEMK